MNITIQKFGGTSTSSVPTRRMMYSHILEVRMDNERTRQKLEFGGEEIRIEDPVQVFSDFFREMQGRRMSDEETKIVEHVFDRVKGDAR